MDHSYSESDVTLSPSQILERLQALRQLQLMQRGKLQKQRLQFQGSSETTNSVMINQFSNSPSYNTFRSLLQSSVETPSISLDTTPRDSNISQKVRERDLIDGVSVLNVSQESEFITYTPTSIQSNISQSPENKQTNFIVDSKSQISVSKKHILLDEMPILSPKKDFEALVLEKLQKESKCEKPSNLLNDSVIKTQTTTKPFLKKGEGMARFGLKKKKLIIQKTQALPWLRKKANNCNRPKINKTIQNDNTNVEKMKVQILVSEPKKPVQKKSQDGQSKVLQNAKQTDEVTNKQTTMQANKHSEPEVHAATEQLHKRMNVLNNRHPLLVNKGKTWAAVLTKEQDDFLRQLKQSEYYKNFVSPSKSTVSDISCNENMYQIRQEKELAEQNMFELLENKVINESFNTENSFIKRFLRKSKLECSGESTPLIMQKCLTNNPDLMHIYPDLTHKKRNDNSHSDAETCNSEYTDCCSETSSSTSSCSTCKTVDNADNTQASLVENVERETGQKVKKATKNKKEKQMTVDSDNKDICQNDEPDDIIKNNMVEMNAKLVATSELLKDRLRELEDEIETFRKENSNLAKLREEVDLERQKFYAEKSAFEQKFNEEKILSEYYLAEEKEKLTKQKQTYDRYLREMRGQLNKKDKDEIANYKKEISDLKDEIRLKDAKSTSTIARLRNQIKYMEKEKSEMKDEIEKLKKEIKKIQHSNDMTRRLTNIKYLEEINKKLSTMTTSNSKTDIELDNNRNYKAFEIERQSRSRTTKSKNINTVRPRAKSVPNLNVTSRYAKYFSQRDIQSEIDQKQQVDVVHYSNSSNSPLKLDNMVNTDNESCSDESFQEKSVSDKEDDSQIENMYMEQFHNMSFRENRPKKDLVAIRKLTEKQDGNKNPDSFFIHSSRSSKSPISILSNRSSNSHKSPTIITNYSLTSKTSMPLKSSFQKSTILEKNNDIMAVSPEPSVITTSHTKTSLNPTEILKPDGSKEIRFPNGNVKYTSNDGNYSKFVYYNGDVKENFYNEGRIKYFYAETKTYHTTHADGLEVLEFPDGQIEKRYKDGSSEIRLPNGSIRYYDPKNEHVREEWRFPDGAALTVSANGEQRIVFSNGQVEVHAKDHKRREFPDGTMKLVYNDGTSETRYASGRVRIKDKHGNLIMDSANT